MNDQPYNKTNSSNPYLIDINKDELIKKDGKKLTASYIWEYKDREELVKWVFDYYRKKGFPYPKYSSTILNSTFNKLKKIDYNSILSEDGTIKNSNSTGTNILKHFCGEKFYNSKVEKGDSPLDVFNDNEKLIKVLKNRMGWCLSKEDGEERPYIFGINDGMIIQGIRSSGLGSSISQFKIPIAMFLYKRYLKENGVILDFSAGWGARMLAAMACGYNYYGIDPLTAENLNEMNSFFSDDSCFKNDINVFEGGSEDKNSYNVDSVDLIIGCPPYFKLEIYSNDNSQCYNKFPEYNDWLEKYWKKTVENCIDIMDEKTKFILIMNKSFKEYMLKDNMLDICFDCGLEMFESFPMKSSKSHLSGKKNSGIATKYSDGIFVLKRE